MEGQQILLDSEVITSICSNLSFEEVVQFKTALGLEVLNCPILVKDRWSERKIILPRVDSDTISVYRAISTIGLDRALIDASMKGQIKNVKMLLKAGADVHNTNFGGSTALTTASQYGHADIVKILLAAGANVNSKIHTNLRL